MTKVAAKSEFERRNRQQACVRKAASMLQRDLPDDGESAREVLAMLLELFRRDPADGTTGETA